MGIESIQKANRGLGEQVEEGGATALKTDTHARQRILTIFYGVSFGIIVLPYGETE